MNKNLPVWLGLDARRRRASAAYAARLPAIQRVARRRRPARVARSGLGGSRSARWPCVLGVATYLLNQRAQPQPGRSSSIKGVPIVVPIIVVLAGRASRSLLRTDVLRPARLRGRRQRRGGAPRRHQRRPTSASLCFVICSTLAAVARHPARLPRQLRLAHHRRRQTLLYAVGAAVIGGTSLFGGKGRVIDAVIGGLVIAVIANGMPLVTQPAGRALHRHRPGPAAGGQRRRDRPAAGRRNGQVAAGAT